MLKEKLVDFVHPLLKQLAEAKSRATTCDHGGHSATTELFEKMERAVRFMEDVSLRLERWEREVLDSVGDMTKHLNDMLLEDDGVNQDEGFQRKLQTVDQKVADLKAHMSPPLVLPPVEEESSSSTLPPHLMTPSLPDVAPNFNVGQRYENLNDPRLQKCLLSLCIFPKDAVIKKRLLIYLWIGDRLATPNENRTAQEDGEYRFKVLVNKGFITPIYRDHNSATDSCRVPPLIRDELLRLAVTNQGFRLHTFGEPIGSLAAPSSVCLLVNAPEKERPPELDPLTTTTTCFNFNRHCLKLERGWLSLMKNIVVLQLGRWQSSARHHVEVDNTEFFESSLGSCKKLRYLSLQGISMIKALPASTGELTNLRILDLRDCNNLERLPVEITMLCQLTHLDVSECYFLDHMPKGLDSLSELQVLKGFVVASSTSRNPPCRLEELSKLKKLRKLSIRIIGRDSLVADGELGQLANFEALRSLTITWGPELSSSSSYRGHLNVSLSRRLEKLDLRCFPGSTAPAWLSQTMLKKLYIRGGRLCEFRFTPTLWGLNILRLRFLNELDMEESELLKAFPDLVFLEIHECKKMSSTARRINRSPEMLSPPPQ